MATLCVLLADDSNSGAMFETRGRCEPLSGGADREMLGAVKVCESIPGRAQMTIRGRFAQIRATLTKCMAKPNSIGLSCSIQDMLLDFGMVQPAGGLSAICISSKLDVCLKRDGRLLASQVFATASDR